MNNFINSFPFDLSDILSRFHKLKKNLHVNCNKKVINFMIYGGYTTNFISDWLSIFLNDQNIKVNFYKAEWGPPFLAEINTKIEFDYVLIINSSFDLINLKSIDSKSVFKLIKRLINYHSSKGDEVFITEYSSNYIQIKSSDYNVEYSITELNYMINDYVSNLDVCLLRDSHFSIFDNINLYSKKNWFLYGNIFDDYGVILFAFKIFLIIHFKLLPKKVLICDLDNTLWHGILADDGVNGVEVSDSTPMGRIHFNLCNYIKYLKDIGVILAICSKNDYQIVENAFYTLKLPLKFDDFAVKYINWDSKSKNVLKISQDLNLDNNSFVFLDDNHSERLDLINNLPNVLTLNVGCDPLNFVQFLNFIDPFSIDYPKTEEDINRNKSIKIDDFEHNYDYLDCLHTTLEISYFINDNINRVEQLTNKTNQFNFTSQRLSKKEIINYANSLNTKIICGKVSDNITNYGLTLLCFLQCEINEKIVFVNNWIMSCRVFSRTIEHVFLNYLVKKYKSEGFNVLLFKYTKTDKNTYLNTLFEKLELKPVNGYVSLNLDTYTNLDSYCKLHEYTK